MILVCPECSTSYELPSTLPDGGAKVRCTSCSHTWTAQPEDLLAEMPAEEAAVEAEAEAVMADEETRPDEEEIPALSPTDEIFEEIDYSDNQDLMEENGQDDIDSLFADFELEEEPVEAMNAGDLEDLFQEDIALEDAEAPLEDEAPEAEAVEAFAEDDADEQAALMAAADDGGDDNSQDDIDSLFDDPDFGATETEEADLEAEAALEALAEEEMGEENSQDDIDGLFDDEPPQDDMAAEAVDPFDSPDIEAEAELTEETAAAAPKLPIWKRVDPKVAAGWGGYAFSLLLFVVVMILARGPVVQIAPAMAGIYQLFDIPVNIRGLAFVNVQQSWQVNEGRIELQVEGEIANLTKRYKTMPRLIIGGLSEDRKEVFRWVAQVREKPLLPNETARFSTQMPAPPQSARHLLIRFDH